MKVVKNSISLPILLALAVLLAACSALTSPTAESPSESPAAAVEEAPADEAAAEPEPPTAEPEEEPPVNPAEADPAAEETQAAESELSGRSEFIDFGYTIAHPAGWFVATEAPVTIISETEEDHALAFVDENNQDAGYSISLDHRDMDFLRGIGLPAQAELIDLYAMNQNFFNWPDNVQPEETEAFGAPALAVKTQDGENWQYTYMGFANDEAFLLVLTAPSEELLQAFLPTWELMLASIEPAAP